MRFLLLLLLPALLLFAACGGDDDDGGSTSTPTADATESSDASRSPTPTEEASSETPTPEPTPTVQPTLGITAFPTQRPDVVADLFAVNTNDLIRVIGGVITENVECPFDASQVVIDCSAQGYGRVAVDLAPRGEIQHCQAVTRADDGALLAVSCNTAEPALWFYEIVE